MSKNKLNEELGRMNKLGTAPSLKEAEISFDSQFTTPIGVSDISVYNFDGTMNSPSNIDLDVEANGKGYVIWSLDPDMRSYGIKSMGLSIDRVSVEIAWEYYNPNEQIKSGVVMFDTKEAQYSDWNVQIDIEFDPSGSIYPSGLEIDFLRKSVTIL